MSPKSPILLLAVALLFLPQSALAQRSTTPSEQIGADSATLTPARGGEILWDQTAGVPSNGFPAQEFGDVPDFSSEGADDFVIPDGESWQITNVFVLGAYGATEDPVELVNLTFYEDADGLPGDAVFAEAVTVEDPEADGDYNAVLSPPLSLGPGTYWVSAQADMNFGVGDQWFWSKQEAEDEVIGERLAWRNPGDGFGTGCTEWEQDDCVDADGNVIGGGNDAGVEASFRIEGTRGAGVVCAGSEVIQVAAAVTDVQLPSTSDGPIAGQSFTAPCSGLISVIGIVPTSDSNPAEGEFILYEGSGAGGSQLATQPFSFTNLPTPGELIRTPVSSTVEVTTGSEYTFFVLPAASNSGPLNILASNADVYDGGITYTSQDGSPANAEPNAQVDLGFEVQFAPIGTASEDGAAPNSAVVSSVFPNPFSALGSFTLDIEQSQDVRVAVYDLLGRERAVLHDGPLSADSHTFRVDASTWSSGIYFVSVQGEAFLATQKFTVVR